MSKALAEHKQGEVIPSQSPERLIELAIEKGADVDQLGKLMDLQERWESRQAEKAFNDALAAFQSECPEIAKNKKVDYTTSKGRTTYNYATLSHIRKTIAPTLEKHGLSYTWNINPNATQVVNNETVPVIEVTCTLKHRFGHSIQNTIPAYPDETGSKNSVQARGSTIQYLQRYSLIGVLGLTSADTDDDGQAAGDGNQLHWLKRHNDALRECLPSVLAVKENIKLNELAAAAEAWFELTDEEKQALWMAPSKGGIFTTEERKVMASKEFRVAYYGDAEKGGGYQEETE